MSDDLKKEFFSNPAYLAIGYNAKGNLVVYYSCNMVRFSSDANIRVKNSSQFKLDDLFVWGGA